MDFWEIFSRVVDCVGVVSLVISIMTLCVTRGIKKSRLVHVEASDYRKDIDAQVHDLDACRKILIEGKQIDVQFFFRLIACLDDVSIAYETILPTKVIKKSID